MNDSPPALPPSLKNYCGCGCGREIPWKNKKGKPCFFVPGHNMYKISRERREYKRQLANMSREELEQATLSILQDRDIYKKAYEDLDEESWKDMIIEGNLKKKIRELEQEIQELKQTNTYIAPQATDNTSSSNTS